MSIMVDHKAVLNKLSGLIESEKVCTTQIYTDEKHVKSKQSILEIARRKTGEEFIVLVIGAFSSGKSSMINALIGEELLPNGFLPETAVLGELRYSNEKRITLYPKKGKWEGGDEPFDLEQATTDEISKYVSLSSENSINSMETNFEGDESDSRIDSKFEKMVIHWPLEILKDGVVLVDSPGINDPYSNDYIVNDYLPNADAIVYVMDSQKAYSYKDKEQLETINSIGRKNIITGYTFYDIVEKQTRRNPQKLKSLRQRLISYMSKHTELGEVSIHFLDSMSGLDARIDQDEMKWRQSGFEGFEDYLGEYLVEGKGKDQVKNMVSTIVIQADSMTKDAARFNSAANEDVSELKKRITEAESRLQIARNNSFQTGRNYRNRLENYIPEVERMVQKFIKEQLPQSVDLEGFEPETKLPEGIGKLNPLAAKRKAKAIQKECQEELTRRMRLEYTKWSNEVLGEYLKDIVKKSAEEINPDLEQIAKDLTNIADLVSGYDVKSSDGIIGNVGNIALGVAFGFITGSWITGAIGAAYGARVMARSALYEIGAGFGLGVLIAAGAPVTIPVVVTTLFLANILAIITSSNKDRIERIRTQVTKDFKKSFADVQSQNEINKMVDGIMENVKSYIATACSEMEKALKNDIINTEKLIKQVINTSNLSLQERNEQIQQRNVAVKKLAELKADAIKISEEYEITDLGLNIG